ncbi:programmed cell death 1 ligand 1 isoform X2 [Tenrec ecaudatus]
MGIFAAITLMSYCHLLNAFTVRVRKDLHVAEIGDNVTLECIFPVEKELDLAVLVVYWEMEDKKIIQLVQGQEDPEVQHSSFRGRAQLLKEQLRLGRAALQIHDVKIRDAGVYCCLISYGGADYKRITLKVSAPYRRINQWISLDPVTLEYTLMCQAVGYPEAEVIWTSSDHQVLSGRTTVSKGEEELLNVTSMLRVNATASEVFHCTFRRPGLQENSTAKLVIPELSVPPSQKRTHLTILGAPLLFSGVVLSFIIYLRQNGKSVDVEKGGVRDGISKEYHDTAFGET